MKLKTAILCTWFGAILSGAQLSGAVLPNDSLVDGKTLADWSAEWWQWLFSVPATRNPGLDPDGSFAYENQPAGSVFFLAGVFGFSDHAVRTIQVPEGKHFFFPILNANSGSDPTDPPTIEERLAGARFYVDSITNLYAELDSVALPDLWMHRLVSPAFTVDYTDTNNLTSYFNSRPIIATFNDVVADGIYLMLSPLSPGDHVIHLGGSMSVGFRLDVIYHVRIVPRPLVEQIQALLDRLRHSALGPPQRQSLEAVLQAGLRSVQKQHLEPGIHQLESFQRLVRSKVMPRDASLGEALLRDSGVIMEQARAQNGGK